MKQLNNAIIIGTSQSVLMLKCFYVLHLSTLAQANEWDKIMSVLVAVSGALPDKILKSAVLMATQKIDWIEAVIAVLTMPPAEKVLVLDEDVGVICCLLHLTH